MSGKSKEVKLERSVPEIDAVYIDIAENYIEFMVKVVKQDKTGLPVDVNDVCLWCGNNFCHSLFV